jgi:hypothetical protein
LEDKRIEVSLHAAAKAQAAQTFKQLIIQDVALRTMRTTDSVSFRYLSFTLFVVSPPRGPL